MGLGTPIGFFFIGLPLGEPVRSMTSAVRRELGEEKLYISPARIGLTGTEELEGSSSVWPSFGRLLGEAPGKLLTLRSLTPVLDVAKSFEMVFWGERSVAS